MAAIPGSCRTLNGSVKCTGSLGLLQSGAVDVHTFPIAINSLDSASSVIDVIETGYETLYAIGTVFPEHLIQNHSSKVVKSIVSTVEIDSTVFFLIPILILITWIGLTFSDWIRVERETSLRMVFHMARVNRVKTTRPWDQVLMRVIECTLRQPNFSSKWFHEVFPRSLLVSVFLFVCMLFTIVYCNLIGSELTLEDPIERMDTLAQFSESNRSIIPEPSGILQTLIKSQRNQMEILRLFKERIPACYMSDKGTTCPQVMSAYVREQKAVYISSHYYHKIHQRFHCMMVVNSLGKKGTGGKPVNRYYVSRETFLPMLLTYVSGKNIDPRVRDKFKSMFRSFSEQGIHVAHQSFVPQLISQGLTSPDRQLMVDACIRNKLLHIWNQESQQTDISLDSIEGSLFVMIGIFACAVIALVIEGKIGKNMQK